MKVFFVTGQQNITVHNKAQNPHDSRSLWVSLGLSESLRVAPGDRGQWYRFDERESSCAVSNATAVDSSFGGEAGAPAMPWMMPWMPCWYPMMQNDAKWPYFRVIINDHFMV